MSDESGIISFADVCYWCFPVFPVFQNGFECYKPAGFFKYTREQARGQGQQYRMGRKEPAGNVFFHSHRRWEKQDILDRFFQDQGEQ